MKLFEQVSVEGNERIACAISKMSGRKVSVSTLRFEEKGLPDVVDAQRPEEVVVGVCLPIRGDLEGTSLLLLASEEASVLCDILFKNEISAENQTPDLKEAAIKEVGNIVCGNYLGVLSNLLQLRLIEGLPGYSVGMAGAILEGGLIEFARKPQKVVFIEIVLKIEGDRDSLPVRADIIFAFSEEAEASIFEILKEPLKNGFVTKK